jgi:hypothetical protein
MIAFRELGYTLLTLLDGATHRRRAGAAVSYLSHKAFRDGKSSYCAPSHHGTKHLLTRT